MELVNVLVVEDDPIIQGMVQDVLSQAGFGTTVVYSGEDAVALLKTRICEFRALVTDIGLRGNLDGWDIGKAAREIDQTFPIVYMSGAHTDDWGSKGVPNSVMLSKPFAPAQLVTAVANLINTSIP